MNEILDGPLVADIEFEASQKRIAYEDSQKAAEEAANRSVMMNLPKGVKIGSPEYQALWNQYYSQELQRRAAGLSYTPGTPAAPAGPVVRGSPTAPLGAQ